jgi:hypothetical protein
MAIPSGVKLRKLLKNWNTLNKALMDLKERDVARLLAHEEANDKRLTFLLRLHARLGVLRRTRERVALVHKAGKNTVLIPGEKYK